MHNNYRVYKGKVRQRRISLHSHVSHAGKKGLRRLSIAARMKRKNAIRNANGWKKTPGREYIRKENEHNKAH